MKINEFLKDILGQVQVFNFGLAIAWRNFLVKYSKHGVNDVAKLWSFTDKKGRKMLLLSNDQMISSVCINTWQKYALVRFLRTR